MANNRSRRSHGRSQRLSVLKCPQTSCGQPLAATDGRRLYVGDGNPQVIVHQKLTFCCGRPGCRGCLTWHPGPLSSFTEDEL